MTTSFAWMTRGNVVRSWNANPAGCVMALLTVPMIVWLVWSAVASEPIGFRSLGDTLLGFVLAAVVLSLVVWLVRLIVTPAALVDPGF
jgi:hypothetical protein